MHLKKAQSFLTALSHKQGKTTSKGKTHKHGDFPEVFGSRPVYIINLYKGEPGLPLLLTAIKNNNIKTTACSDVYIKSYLILIEFLLSESVIPHGDSGPHRSPSHSLVQRNKVAAGGHSLTSAVLL